MCLILFANIGCGVGVRVVFVSSTFFLNSIDPEVEFFGMMGMTLERVAVNGVVTEMEGMSLVFLRVATFLFNFVCILVVVEGRS